jgi:phospholipase C
LSHNLVTLALVATAWAAFFVLVWGIRRLARRRLAAQALLALPLAAALAAAQPAGAAHSQTALSSSPIQHVVVVYLENHSFDNVLGYWCDDSPGRCPDGGMPSSVTLSDGSVVTPSTTPDVVPQINHSVAAQQAAMHIVGGVPLMDGWENIPNVNKRSPGCIAAQGYECISGYQPTQIPNLAALATQFAISDATFSMADSPSWGGHLYAAMASTDGFTGDNPAPVKGTTPGPGWGCDSNMIAPWVAPGRIRWIPSCIPDYRLGLPNGGAFGPTPAAYHASIFDSLDNAQPSLPWRIYGTATATGGGSTAGYGWSICPSLAECLDTSQRANLVDNSQFFTDAAAGTLPAFSIVTAGGTTDGTSDGHSGVYASCHNGYPMTACDNYIGALARAVETSPDWASTAMFITWDDFGGFYDQVPPSTNPDYTQQGPRTPLIIVSPYARPGYTDTAPATFAGILAYTEQNFGLPPLGPNDARAYPFTNAFDYSQSPVRPVRIVTRPVPSGDHIVWSQGKEDS